MSLPSFSVRQKVLVSLLFFVCLLGGLGAFSRIPVEFFQDVNLNQASVTTIWPGASAEELETSCARPPRPASPASASTSTSSSMR